MLSWGMPKGGIGVGAASSENGDTINDEIMGTNESSSHGV
jgi:hypothetical protein